MSAEWQAFWTSWQFDAWLTLALVLVALIYLRGWLRLRQRGARRFSPWRLAAFFLAVSTVGLATQSPIEPFSTLLLQMHMLQHVLLMFVAPPLVWMADPELPLLVGLPKVLRRHLAVPILRDPLVRWVTHLLAHPAVALGLFVVTAWTWHLPALYQAALTSQTWHQVEHASFFLAAIVFWRVVIGPYPNRSTLSRWIVLPYLLVAGLQGTVFSGTLRRWTTRRSPGHSCGFPVQSLTFLRLPGSRPNFGMKLRNLKWLEPGGGFPLAPGNGRKRRCEFRNCERPRRNPPEPPRKCGIVLNCLLSERS
jgi:putative membrane protein